MSGSTPKTITSKSENGTLSLWDLCLWYIDGVELCTEIQNINFVLGYLLYTSTINIALYINILQCIFDYEFQNMFPNLCRIVLRLLLTIPATVASLRKKFFKIKTN